MDASSVVDAAAEIQHKTCKVTLVTPGQSDRVIKVYPAEHEAEKIWLDNAPGLERWEMVRRLIYTSAERGTRVPDPAPYHTSTKDFKTVDLKEGDIPFVKLVDAVLRKPPEKETFNGHQPQAMTSGDISNRFNSLESSIAQLATAISLLAANKVSQQAAPAAPAPAAEVACQTCGKQFKNAAGLRLHKGKYHKSA